MRELKIVSKSLPIDLPSRSSRLLPIFDCQKKTPCVPQELRKRWPSFWSGAICAKTGMIGWSERFFPTAGKWLKHWMPCFRKWLSSPIPDNIKSCGEMRAPALKITSFWHWISTILPLRSSSSIPVAWSVEDSPSSKIFLQKLSLATWKVRNSRSKGSTKVEKQSCRPPPDPLVHNCTGATPDKFPAL